MQTKIHVYRASIVHFPSATQTPSQDYVYFKDGGLVVQDERIVACGNYADIRKQYPHAELVDYSGKLLLPGFIDSHLHFPQTEMIASYGEQLLSWLENYTFPTELKFADALYSQKIATLFIEQLLSNGTTTALAFSSVHPSACDAIFEQASKHNMAFVAGKVCMDRMCPDNLQDTAKSAQAQSAELIQKWHNKGRNLYAITPRFAPTSTPEQLAMLGELAQQYPDVFIQTHLSENPDEIAWVNSLFPTHKGYLDVYDAFNLVRERAVFGHCIHLKDEEWACLKDKGASIAFCPTSNLFLGSGLFDLQKAKQYQVPVTLASDVGAGTSFNMLRTYSEAYKVGQMQQQPLCAMSGLYMMTQGAACAHKLEHSIGNLNPSTHADFVIIDPQFNTLSTLRNSAVQSCEELLFALSILGDDRAVVATYVAGENRLPHFSQEFAHALA